MQNVIMRDFMKHSDLINLMTACDYFITLSKEDYEAWIKLCQQVINKKDDDNGEESISTSYFFESMFASVATGL